MIMEQVAVWVFTGASSAWRRRDLVIPPPQEFDQAEAVAEGVGKEREFPPAVCLCCLLERRAGCQGAIHRGVDILHDDVQVHRRPVPPIVSQLLRAGGRLRSRSLHQQIDRRRRAQELDTAVAETTARPQIEGAGVEVDGVMQVINVDVDKQVDQDALPWCS
jgi:hypothetical protein